MINCHSCNWRVSGNFILKESKMNNMKTHTRVVDMATKRKGLGFDLSPMQIYSANFSVTDMPISLLAWGLQGGDWLEIRRVRVGSLGNRNWNKTDDCCPVAIEPDEIANLESMPYVRCGAVVRLDANNAHQIIDDVGDFVLVYHGDNDISVDVMRDVVQRKCCCGENDNGK